MRPRQLLLASILCLFALSGQAQTNYYVSPSGDDNNSGTMLQSPWQHVQRAANAAMPGSTVNILAGTYNELVTMNVSGTIGNPITFKNYLGGTVIITKAGVSPRYSGLLSIVDKNNIILDGLTLQGLVAPGGRAVLVYANPGSTTRDIVLRNLTVTNIKYADPPIPSGTADDNANGIVIYGTGTTPGDAIRNVTVENCRVYGNANGSSENITVSGNVLGFAIRNNVVYNNLNVGIDIAGHKGASTTPAVDQARRGVVSGNITYNNIHPTVTSAGIYCDGCRSTIIERNTTYANPVGISIGCEVPGTADSVTVRDNLIYQNSYSGIGFGADTQGITSSVQNSVVSNNTCYYNGNGLGGQLRIAKVNNCAVFNNLFFSNGNLLYYLVSTSPQSFTSDYNTFFTANGNVALAEVNRLGTALSYGAYQTLTGQETHSMFSDPRLVGAGAATPDFHLQSTSPCINAGSLAYTPPAGELDIDGQNRATGRVDIGADEYYGNLATPSATPAAPFAAYPNPATQDITITPVRSADSQHLQVYNTLGQLVQELPLTGATRLFIGHWPAGLYLLKLKEQPQSVLKLVKQ